MSDARRSAPDAPPWYRRVFRRAARPRPPVPETTAVTLPRWELALMVVLAVFSLLILVSVAAAISYSHMFDWALANGEPRWRARLSPLSADGAIFAASVVAFVDSRLKLRADPMAYTIILSGIAWSVFANVFHDWVSPVAAKLIAGWPPIALAATLDLLLRFARRLRERSDQIARQQREAADAERAKSEKAQKAQKAAPPVPAPRPKTLPESIAPEVGDDAPDVAVVAGPDPLTEAMRHAGWAPADYTNLGDAMRGYLEKVDPEASGADLHRLIAVPFFGAAKDTGRGRQIVREFKAAQAARATADSGGE